MKIIKHGNIRGVFQGACSTCNCIFECGAGELEVEHYTDVGTVVKKRFLADCPECG